MKVLRPIFRRRRIDRILLPAAALLAVACGPVAFAQAPSASPSPAAGAISAPSPLQAEPGIDLCFKGGGQEVLAQGQTPSKFVETLRAEGDSFIPLGDPGTFSWVDLQGVSHSSSRPYRLRAQAIVDFVGVTAPTSTFDPTSLQSIAAQVTALEFSGELYYQLGSATAGKAIVAVSAGCEAGQGSTISGLNGAALLYPNPTFWGCGLDLRELTSKAWLKAHYGGDQRVGSFGNGMLEISAEIPLSVTQNVIYVGAQYVHPIGAAYSLVTPLERLTFGVQVPELLALFQK